MSGLLDMTLEQLRKEEAKAVKTLEKRLHELSGHMINYSMIRAAIKVRSKETADHKD